MACFMEGCIGKKTKEKVDCILLLCLMVSFNYADKIGGTRRFGLRELKSFSVPTTLCRRFY